MKKLRSTLHFFLIIWLALAQPYTSYAKTSNDLDDIVKSFENGKIAISIDVYAFAKHRDIYGYNAHTPLNPASTMKVITTMASLRYLGAQYTYSTLYSTDQHYENVIHNLYIKGSGDPTLTVERFERIAKKLKSMGITQIRGDIMVDNTYFLPDPPLPTTLCKHMATNAAWALNPCYAPTEADAVKTTKSENETINAYALSEYRAPAIVNKNTPARTAVKGSKKNSKAVKRATPTKQKSRVVRAATPELQAGETLKQILVDSGVSVLGKVISHTDQGFIALFQDNSDPLSTILKAINKHSNNFMAEMLLKKLAAEQIGPPGSMQKGALFLTNFMSYSGIPLADIHIENGSGLSRDNRVSAYAMTRALVYAYNDPLIRNAFIASFPIAGTDGTLKKRLLEPELVGNVHAKTGTLADTCALAGYMTAKSGNDIAFTIIVNGPGAGGQYFPLHEKLLAALFEAY